jgi:hypothetical protein
MMRKVGAIAAAVLLAVTPAVLAKHHDPEPPRIVGGIGLAPTIDRHGLVPAPPAPQKSCNESGDCATSGCKSPPSKPKPKPRSSCLPQAPPRGPATNGNGRGS